MRLATLKCVVSSSSATLHSRPPSWRNVSQRPRHGRADFCICPSRSDDVWTAQSCRGQGPPSQARVSRSQVNTCAVSGGGVEVQFRFMKGCRRGFHACTGLDSVPNGDQEAPVRVGQRFDRVDIEAARDTIARRLRNAGILERKQRTGSRWTPAAVCLDTCRRRGRSRESKG